MVNKMIKNLNTNKEMEYIGGCLKKEHLYKYLGEYVSFKTIKTEYYFIKASRKFLGFHLKDKKERISEKEYLEYSKDKIINYGFIKEWNNLTSSEQFTLFGLFKLIGVPLTRKYITIEIMNLKTGNRQNDQFIEGDVSTIPSQFCQYRILGKYGQKDADKFISEYNKNNEMY